MNLVDRFPEEMYQRCLTYYRNNQPCGWTDAWRAVQQWEADQQAPGPQHYARERYDSDDQSRVERILDYQRDHASMSFEEAAAAMGETFGSGLMKLDASGLVVAPDRPRVDYVRRPAQGTFSQAELKETAWVLGGCSMDQAHAFLTHYLGLIRERRRPPDVAWSESVAHVFGSAKPNMPHPGASRESTTVTPPKHEQVSGTSSGAGGEGFFAVDPNPWNQSAMATSAPVSRGTTPTVKRSSGRTGAPTGKPTPLPRPEPGLPMKPNYEREIEEMVQHYRSMGVPDAQARDLATEASANL
jgi:hypothetical protein